MDAIVIDAVSAIGILAVAVGLSLLVGSAIGYYSASSDAENRIARARRAGFDSGVNAALASRRIEEGRLRATLPDEDQADPWGAGR